MIQLPPERYDYPCTATEFVLPAPMIAEACRVHDSMACTLMHAPGGPIIVLPKVGPGGVAKRTQDLLRRHECGHVNGWGADHAGGH